MENRLVIHETECKVASPSPSIELQMLCNCQTGLEHPICSHLSLLSKHTMASMKCSPCFFAKSAIFSMCSQGKVQWTVVVKNELIVE